MRRSAKNIHKISVVIKIFYVILLVLLVFTLLLVAVAFAEPEYYEVGVFCLITGILPILLAIYKITTLKKELTKKRALTDYLLSRKQVKIEEIASFLGTSPEKAYEELLTLEGDGYLSFSLDNDTGIYIITQFTTQLEDDIPRAADFQAPQAVPAEDYSENSENEVGAFEVR